MPDGPSVVAGGVLGGQCAGLLDEWRRGGVPPVFLGGNSDGDHLGKVAAEPLGDVLGGSRGRGDVVQRGCGVVQDCVTVERLPLADFLQDGGEIALGER
ncbi:hypothetical protein DKG34_05590 [Streptomyces sp. NWU49]|nr:hypothetical protein DKG34_05590 [Streptomyces sp. NWU49]